MDKQKERREKENAELLVRMRDPADSLQRYNAAATFFPPRPIIVKDFKEMARIYAERHSQKDSDDSGHGR